MITAALLSALTLVTACGGKVVVDASSGSGGSGAGGGGAITATSTSTGVVGGCGVGMLPCPPDQYCDFQDDTCGGGLGSGVCAKRPPFCDDSGPADPVCGCNGKLYAYGCDASLAGQDRGPNTLCSVSGTYFTCGPVLVCDATQSYCQHNISDVVSDPDTWVCLPFPQCGGQTGCSCVLKTPCGSFCEVNDANHVTVTCPGG